jgi:hypothetical protein
MHRILKESNVECRWFHSKILEDLQSTSTISVDREITVKILTGGKGFWRSSSDELIPNSDLSRESYLHSSVSVWLKGMFKCAAQQILLTSLKDEPRVCLTMNLSKEHLAQLIDHIVTITESSFNKQQ